MANPVDAIVSFFSPRKGAERSYYRTVLHNARQFDAAKLSRRTQGWVATGGSANAETANGLDRIRFRARDLERNNSQAAGILRKLPAYIVGAGIRARPSDGDKPVLARNWKAFCKSSDISGGTNFDAQMHLATRTLVRDGEVLLVYKPTPDPKRPLALHVLEADHLDTSRTAELSGGTVIIQGVEFDADGRRVAYWLFDQHPGEPVAIKRSSYVSRRVDAKYVDHIFDILRPGQARGVPWCSPVALRLRDVAEYEDAELVRKKIEACFAVFITRADADGTVPAGPKPQSIDQTTGKVVDTMTPGMIQRLALGENVTFGEPRQQIGVGDYLKSQWLSIAFGVGMPYSMATGDLSNANYGSQRAGLLDFWTLLDNWQWNMMVAMAYEKAWTRAHEAFARLGVGPSDIPDAAYAPPKREWIDPEKDGKATLLKIRSGLMTWPQAINEAGEDAEEQYKTIAEWKPKLEEAELDFTANGATSAPDLGQPIDLANPDAPPAADAGADAAKTGRLIDSMARLTDAMALEAVSRSRVEPPPVPIVNVAPPAITLAPVITLQERADGTREIIVERDGNNRIKSARLAPSKPKGK